MGLVTEHHTLWPYHMRQLLNCTDLCKCSNSCKNKDTSDSDDCFIDFDDEDAYENDEKLDFDNVN
jgi:hypothetical protein